MHILLSAKLSSRLEERLTHGVDVYTRVLDNFTCVNKVVSCEVSLAESPSPRKVFTHREALATSLSYSK